MLGKEGRIRRPRRFWVGVVLASIGALFSLAVVLSSLDDPDLSDVILGTAVIFGPLLVLGIALMLSGWRQPSRERAELSRKGRGYRIALFFVGVTLFTLIGIVMVPLGVISLLGQKNVGPTLQTTAVVSDMKTKEIYHSGGLYGGGYSETVYHIYLDFSDSQIDPELTELLSQQQQGLDCSREQFDHFYVGKQVTIVYHIIEAGVTIHFHIAIESIDGYHPKAGIGDLTTPRHEREESIAVTAIGGAMLGLAVFLFVLWRRGKLQTG